MAQRLGTLLHSAARVGDFYNAYGLDKMSRRCAEPKSLCTFVLFVLPSFATFFSVRYAHCVTFHRK